jgi:hypothetical protein
MLALTLMLALPPAAMLALRPVATTVPSFISWGAPWLFLAASASI